jgi:CheY-like chemotaxis protein
VCLPIAAVRHGDHGRPRFPAEQAPERLPVLEGLCVLVVDDQADARESVTAVLEERGAHVVVVASAAEALEAIERYRPQVLVSDIGMPGEDGYELIRKVRALRPEEGGRIPAAALTAYARIEDRAQALQAGYQIHVPKPVDPAALIAVVARLAEATRAA